MRYMTREEAIKKVGIDAVDFVERIICQPTERDMDNDDVEFSATIYLTDNYEFDNLTAFYYQDKDDVAKTEDLDDLIWIIHGYIVKW